MQSDTRRLLLALTGRLGLNLAMLAGLVVMIAVNRPARMWRTRYGAKPLHEQTPVREHGKYRLETAAADLFIAHFGTDPAYELQMPLPPKGQGRRLNTTQIQITSYPRQVIVNRGYDHRLSDAQFDALAADPLETRSSDGERLLLARPRGDQDRRWRIYYHTREETFWLVIAPAELVSTAPARGEGQ